MSYAVSIRIWCDTDGCQNVWEETWINRGGASKTFAGTLAADQGWAIPGFPGSKDPKKAWCPDHAAGKITRRPPLARFSQGCEEHSDWFYSKTAWERHLREEHRSERTEVVE